MVEYSEIHLIELADTVPTPFLYIDLDVVKKKYLEMTSLYPEASIYYAVKANPHPDIIQLLADLGSSFDIASIPELKLILSKEVDPSRISYGNTIKKSADIETAYNLGVRLFATDSLEDLENIARLAPSSSVFFRLIWESNSSDWPLSRKFGAHPDLIYTLAKYAARNNLIPIGLSFHVGSQQNDSGEFSDAISQCAHIFNRLAFNGIRLKLLNIGGGIPVNYSSPTLTTSTYLEIIGDSIFDEFGGSTPNIIMEPGRSLVADSGTIVSSTILVSKKSLTSLERWAYIDIGKFGGLIETIDESIKYKITTSNPDSTLLPTILAGPTCDGLDILYEKNKLMLPKSLKEGDLILIHSTGAYTSSYSSIEFNGIPPLNVITSNQLKSHKHSE